MLDLTGFIADQTMQLRSILAGRKARKIFAIGENKTGTTSIHKIFQDLGYRSYHGIKWRDTSHQAIFYRYDCFTDGPPDDIRKLDRLFPNSKFILQVRDLDAWLDSRIEHIKRLPKKKKRHPLWSAKESSARIWLRRRDEYHLDVLSYFRNRPDDLLLINFIRDPDAASRIADFLGSEAHVSKPHANRNPIATKALKNPDMIAATLNGLGIAEHEWKNDIYCPSLKTREDYERFPADTSFVHKYV